VRRQLQGQRQLVQALETSGWRDALLGFFTGVAGPAAERVRADIFAAPRFYAAQLMRDIVASGPPVTMRRSWAAVQCPLMYVHSQIPTDLERLRELTVRRHRRGNPGRWP